MTEQRDRQHNPLDARVLGGACIVLVGVLAVMWGKDIHEVAEGAESATSTELTGVAYRITRS